MCEQRKVLREKRSALALPLNNPQYQILPRAERRNYWEYSYEDYGDSYEDGDVVQQAWLDGDFGMRSTNFKQNVFSPHKNTRRQRNMKVKTFYHHTSPVQLLQTGLTCLFSKLSSKKNITFF